MKFKKLTIKNIGSIESKTIDFTADPLGNASLFLISGPTGSGKSIILDAVCLALYGTSPRLEKGSSSENYNDPQFNCSVNGSISLKDARQLVRRGTTSAMAELVFDGNDGKEYVASWSAKRGKKEELSTRLTDNRSVKSTDGTEEYNKVTECDKFIASPNVVGLKFDEFCRTTLLAQGEFTKFLDSDTKEKADILEKVTGTEKFSAIGDRINKKYKELDDSAKGLIKDINDVEKQPMKVEDRKALLEENDGLDNKRKDHVASRTLLSEKKSILDRQKLNAENDAKADKNIETAKAQKATEGYKSAVKTSADWKASLDVRSSLRTREEASKAMQKALNERASLSTSYSTLTGNLLWLEDSLGQFDELDKQIKTQERTLAEAKKEHEKLNPEGLAKNIALLGSEKNNLDLLLKQAQNWLNVRKSIIGQKELDSFTSEQKKLYEEESAKAQAFWMAKDTVKAAQKQYEEVFAGFQDHAAAIRATLKEGDTCPVCGNIIKTILTDDAISSILKPYKDGITDAQDSADKAKEECDNLIIVLSKKAQEKDQELSVLHVRNTEVSKSATRIAALTAELSDMQKKASTKVSIEDAIKRISDVKGKVKSSLGAEEPANPIKCENRNLEAQWNNLSVKVHGNLTEYSSAESTWKQANDEIEKYAKANPEFSEEYLVKLAGLGMKDINELDRKVKIVDDMETSAIAQKEACKAECEAIMKEVADKGIVFADGETSASLSQDISSIDNEISGIDTRKGEISKALEIDDMKVKSMKKTREEYEKIRPILTNYETLNSLFGQNGGTLFKRIAQSHLLGILLENANFYLSQFTDRYELIRQEGSLVVLMKDKQQDDVPRPANTLSGGESFMASLALALGLSSFNSGNFCADTIFIDEGFGTLSPNCLASVYETLSSLKKSTGKKVGIISHVEELKEQIHPQIVVEPLGNGLSRINDPA